MINQFIIHYGIHYFANNAIYLFDRAVVYYGSKCQERATAAIREKINSFNLSLETRNIDQSQNISAKGFDNVIKCFEKVFCLDKPFDKVFSGHSFVRFEEFSKEDAQLFLLWDILLANPLIIGYLARKLVETQDNDLVLLSKYEETIYQANVPLWSRLWIPYRSPHGQHTDVRKAFYALGSINESMKICFEMEKLKIDNRLGIHINFLYESNIYEVAARVPLISRDLKENKLEIKRSFSYYVFPGWKDDHAYLMVVVFDTNTGNARCALLINSWKSDRYHLFLKCRFQGCQGCATIPFIDCSIDVQKNDENDTNCGIYASVIGRAFVELCHEKSDQLDEIVQNYQEDKVEVKGDLQEFVRSNIVGYLPEYFYENENKKFQTKSMEELRDFHMQKRWDIGNQRIRKESEEAKRRLKEQGII